MNLKHQICYLPRALVLVLALAGLSACSEQSGYPLLEGGAADFDQEERLVLVNYWAVWCGPCIAEMPELAEFNDHFESRAIIYAVNFDMPSEEKLKADVARLNVQIPSLLIDPSADLGYDVPDTLPATAVVKNGVLQDVLVGPQTLETLEAVLNHYTAG